MTGTRHQHRFGAVLVGSTLITAILVQAPEAQAAPRPSCFGKPASMIGTDKADILKGTAKADVIVAKGGNDRILGRGGGDRICGGGGNDKLYGQGGDDILNGGPGSDSCYQAAGSGSKQSCEGPRFPLSVSLSGTGGGTVTSSPAGIDCGSDCSLESVEGTEVSLTATPSAGSTFTGWGGSCSGATACTVSMNGPRSVTASFAVQQPQTLPLPPELPPVELPPVIEPLALSVLRAGNGSGAVTSSPAGVDCGSVCAPRFDPGTSVVLTAVPDTGSEFSTWTGCDAAVANVCTVLMDTTRSVTVSFTLLSYDVSLALTGSGDGWVTSVPSGINCGIDCVAPYDFGTTLVLTATADVGSLFTGWTGGGCSGVGTCTLIVSETAGVTASFMGPYNLTVNRTGGGAGTVTSSPNGINCGSDCFEGYELGTVVTLTAVPGQDSLFSGWSGSGCSGAGVCVVTMSAARSVTATFIRTLTLTVTTNGAGTVTSSPAGINCGVDCSETYSEDTLVTLNATPDLLHVFVSWSGGCSGIIVPTCVVTMSTANSVSANFL